MKKHTFSGFGKLRYKFSVTAVFLMLSVFMTPLFTTGCRSSGIYVYSPSDAITENEKQAIIAYIKHFVSKSNLSLSRAERNFVRNTDPVFKIHYTGYKRGELTVRWNFPNYRSIILKRKGHLLFEGKIHWDVRIITDMASPTIPRSMFGSKGEDITRMSPEAAEVLKQWQGDTPGDKR